MKAFPSEWTEFHPSTTGSSHVSNARTIKHSEGGMDLRDYFAAHAMQAIITRYPLDKGGWNEELVGISAYLTADAMMKARVDEEGL